MRNRKRDALSQLVVNRFYEAFYELKPFSMTVFCKMVNISTPTFYKQKTAPEVHYMDFSWLIPLINAGVSAKWLLTGEGKMKK